MVSARSRSKLKRFERREPLRLPSAPRLAEPQSRQRRPRLPRKVYRHLHLVRAPSSNGNLTLPLTNLSGILSGRVSKPPTASKQRITTVKLEQEFNSPTPPSPREPSADAGLRSPSSGNLHKKAFHKSPASSSNMGFEHINMQYFGQLEDADFYGQEV